MDNYKPCDIYDHSIILLRSKISDTQLEIDDLMNQEIIFNNNDFKLYVKKPDGTDLIKYGELNDAKITLNNVWSQSKQKNEIIKYSLIF